ncbi:putative glycosyl transferase [Acephala macrosclerotiorum]|nr:putative glycosyl transferase [Acephala macrosclerotiorum]
MAATSFLLNYNCRIIAAIVFIVLVYFRHSIQVILSVTTLPITWRLTSSDFFISQARDHFDITFGNYSDHQQSSEPDYPDLIPPILHQISLGHREPREKWMEARKACLSYHPNWETYLWTDGEAAKLVEEKFPHLKDMWYGYKYPIQRIDALRYMVLHEYGGVVLDMDLECRRSLGPLRRFDFVAPAAHPVGFSNGFLMASKGHPFVAELLRNLPIFNWNWLGLPYATVMFSTGCHYASVIHALQSNRSNLRILGGTPESPNLHRLNGHVITPLFQHLGASSWHSFDAHFIVSMGKLAVPLAMFGVSCGCIFAFIWAGLLQYRLVRARRASTSAKSFVRLE